MAAGVTTEATLRCFSHHAEPREKPHLSRITQIQSQASHCLFQTLAFLCFLSQFGIKVLKVETKPVPAVQILLSVHSPRKASLFK